MSRPPPVADMLSIIHQSIGVSQQEPIPLNVCSLLSPNCDSFDIQTVHTKLFLLPQATCFTVAETKDPVPSAQGFVYLPHYTFDNHPDIDILVVGAGDFSLQSVKDWLQKTVPKVCKYVIGICGGATVLAAAGVLDGKRATASKFGFPMLTQFGNGVMWDNTVNYVQDGKFLTTSGACAGIDGAFHLIKLLYGHEVAMKLSFINEHRWLTNPNKDPLAHVFENGTLKPNAVEIYEQKNN